VPIALPAGLDAHIASMTALAASLAGHLTAREVRFLALLGAVPTARGEVLEIGSFKGKSTIILARSARFAGQTRVCAVDPLDLPSATDPTDAPPGGTAEIFRANLKDHGVDEMVEFHQMTSQTLGRQWNRPLRLLWIDGDHTYAGAKHDYDAFARHLAPGAIVAFHDVLHWYEGPPRVLIEGPLASPLCGACGVTGSIGWAQFLGDAAIAAPYAAARERLARRLRALLPYAGDDRPARFTTRLLYKLHRARVPHRERPPSAWAAAVRTFAA
jgi:MMP 1-O-methyltransferase